MERGQLLAGAGGPGVAAAAGVVGWELFAPETATRHEETDWGGGVEVLDRSE